VVPTSDNFNLVGRESRRLCRLVSMIISIDGIKTENKLFIIQLWDAFATEMKNVYQVGKVLKIDNVCCVYVSWRERFLTFW